MLKLSFFNSPLSGFDGCARLVASFIQLMINGQSFTIGGGRMAPKWRPSSLRTGSFLPEIRKLGRAFICWTTSTGQPWPGKLKEQAFQTLEKLAGKELAIIDDTRSPQKVAESRPTITIHRVH